MAGFWKWSASLGVGLLPLAPGTWGSFLAAAVLWLSAALGGFRLCGWGYWGALGLLILASLVATDRALWWECFGESNDPSQVVIDEAAGVMVAFYGLGAWPLWQAIAALAAFRLFDIAKPFPVGWSQSLPGAWGVVVDDLLAGLYALALVWILRSYLG